MSIESEAGKGDLARKVSEKYGKNYSKLFGSEEEVRRRRLAYIAEQKAKKDKSIKPGEPCGCRKRGGK